MSAKSLHDQAVNLTHTQAVRYTEILMALDAAKDGRDSGHSHAVVSRMTLRELRDLLPEVEEIGVFVDALDRAMAGKKEDFVDRHHMQKLRSRMQSKIDMSTMIRSLEAKKRREELAQLDRDVEEGRHVFL